MTQGGGAEPDAQDAGADAQDGQGAQDTLPAFGLLEPMLASIVDLVHAGTEFRFLIANPFDYIHGHHARGVLYETDSLAMIARHFPQGGRFVPQCVSSSGSEFRHCSGEMAWEI